MLHPPFPIEIFSSSLQLDPADAAFLTSGNVFQSFLKKIMISIFFLKIYPFLPKSDQRKTNQLLAFWCRGRFLLCQTTNIHSACIFWNKFWLLLHCIWLLFHYCGNYFLKYTIRLKWYGLSLLGFIKLMPFIKPATSKSLWLNILADANVLHCAMSSVCF